MDSRAARVNGELTMPRSSPATEDPVAIIGAGIGGLAAAIRLAAAGQSVTVFEAAEAPGGKMRSLPSCAGPVDAGPTVLTLRGVFDALFAAAGTRLEDHLRLIPQPLLARHFWSDGAQLDLYADPEASTNAIRAFAGPLAAIEFQSFQAHSAALMAAFDGSMMRAARPQALAAAGAALRNPALWPALMTGRSLAADLARRFTDPRLRQLFGRYATYVGGAPDRSPAVLALIWQAEAAGVWAVAGGMHRLAQALEGLARAQGAAFRYRTPIARFEAADGRLSALITTQGERVPCRRAVFNGDPAALADGFLGADAARALPRRAAHPRSLSARVWSFAARVTGPDLTLHNVLFADDPAAEFGPIAGGRHPVDPTIYICAQDRAEHRPEGSERFEFILNAPALCHAGGAERAEPDPKEAERCSQMTFNRLARFGLTFDPLPGPAALTMPEDFAARFPGSRGALYGRSPQGSLASFLRPTARTRMPGLYLAGGGAHPGAGVPMAALSGQHAAEAILADRVSTSRSRPTATPGGMSMASATTERAPSR